MQKKLTDNFARTSCIDYPCNAESIATNIFMNPLVSSTGSRQFPPSRNERWHSASSFFPILALTAGLLLPTGTAQAQNILVNPSFEVNSGQNIPTSWTYFAPPSTTGKNYWIITSTDGCSPLS